MGNKHLTACEARKLTSQSDHVLNFIYKTIEKVARMNECETPISFMYVDSDVREKILAQLKTDGYSLKVIEDCDCPAYIVSW